jgi:hypothetical protein
MAKFTYRKRTYEETKSQISEADSGIRDGYLTASIPLFKPAEGTNRVRILPPGWENADHYGYRIFVHYQVGPNNDAYICPFNTVNPHTGETKLRCPICEERQRVAVDDPDYAKTLKPASRVLVYILVREGKSKPVLKAWSMPASLDKTIMMQAVDDDTREVLPVDCPEEGYDLDVVREGTSLTTKYAIKVARRPSAIEDFEEEIWSKISGKNSLPENLIFYDYDYLTAVFSGAPASGVKTNEIPEKKKAKKIDLESLTEKDLQNMDENELIEVIETMGSEIDPSEYETLDDLVIDIADELKKMFKPKTGRAKPEKPVIKEPEPEQEEEEEEEEEKPKPPSTSSRLAGLRNRNK